MSVSKVLFEAIDSRILRASKPGAAFAQVDVASPLTVTFPGDTVAVPVSRLSSYSPTVGDTAILLRVGTRFVALGALA